MKNFRVAIEFSDPAGNGPEVKWEQSAKTDMIGAFMLLGRAFEISQRDANASFSDALIAFFHGALIQKEDVQEVLTKMESVPHPHTPL